MQEIWLKLDEHNDLFNYWEHELHIRKEFRNNFNLNQSVKVDNHKQIDFLYRSLYLCNKKDEFFLLLALNLNQAPALNWLKQANFKLMASFLKWIPKYITFNKPTPEQLQFLVHIYNSELNNYFIPICELLTSGQCQFILNRTANKELRNLLKNRQAKIEAEEQQLLYGFDLNKSLLPYPTLHGDKAKLILDTISLLHHNYTTSYSSLGEEAYFSNLLQIAQSLFEVGLVEDSLHILIALYEHYQHFNKLVDWLEDEKMVKALNKLVRRVLPIYALLYEPQAFDFTLQVYNHYFTRLTPDIASLTYLRIYEKLALISKDFTTTILELHQEILKIRSMRPEETPLLLDHELLDGLSSDRILEVLHLADSKLLSLPHEAFITLEFLRHLSHHGFINILEKDTLALNYLNLFRWLPTSLFINKNIYEDLITNTSFNMREQWEKTYKLITHYDNSSIWIDIKEKPDLFKLKTEELRRIILTGKFMGVL